MWRFLPPACISIEDALSSDTTQTVLAIPRPRPLSENSSSSDLGPDLFRTIFGSDRNIVDGRSLARAVVMMHRQKLQGSSRPAFQGHQSHRN